MFMFSRVHPYNPGVKIAYRDTATIGAYHTAGFPYLFGTLDALNIIRLMRNWTAYLHAFSSHATKPLVGDVRDLFSRSLLAHFHSGFRRAVSGRLWHFPGAFLLSLRCNRSRRHRFSMTAVPGAR
jgi:hypothetical protein